MKKCLFIVAALTLAASAAWVGNAAAVTSQVLKADTLAMNFADSSAVVNVEGAARLWLDFIIPPGAPCDLCLDAGTDTVVTLLVQVREVLSSTAGTDSTLGYDGATDVAGELGLSRQYVQGAAGNADSTAKATALNAAAAHTPAAYSDTTVVPWNPRYNMAASTSAVDSVRIGGTSPTILVASSSEYVVVIPAYVQKYGNSQRTARVDLINVNTGAPFRAQFASFKWRLVGGVGSGSGPVAVKLRVVLGRETW